MGDPWSGFAGAVVGGLLAAALGAWAAARYTHIQALRLAWADWTASALELFQAMVYRYRIEIVRESPFTARPPKHEYDAVYEAKNLVEERRSRLERDHVRLVLIENEPAWLQAAESIHEAGLGGFVDESRFAEISDYLRESLVSKNRERLRAALWLEETAPRPLRKLMSGISG